jgi:hypothetical protein
LRVQKCKSKAHDEEEKWRQKNVGDIVFTKILQVDSDLVHAASVRLAEDNAGGSVEFEFLEGGAAVLALGRHFAHANLVADHLDGLRAANLLTENSSEKLSHNRRNTSPKEE